MRVIDETGNQYGRLVVVERVEKDHPNAFWLCKCQCGNETVAKGTELRNGHTKSCGCLQRESAAKMGKVNAGNGIHNMHKSPEYRAWIGMKVRCHNKKIKAYKNYGGRGVTVCNRWINSFSSFFADMGLKPSMGHSLDRIDNEGNYYPEICRWATRYEQNINRRRVGSFFSTVELLNEIKGRGIVI